MAAVWQMGEARVEDVRAQRPGRKELAYTTIQTVMNRLVDRGLLERERQGNAFVYRPRYAEAEYVAAHLQERLRAASPDARREALASLIGGLKPDEIDEIARLATRIRRSRKD